jgi:hypothetical protein
VDGILEAADRPLVPGESYLKRKYKSVERGDEGNQSQLSMGNSPNSAGDYREDVPRSRHSNRSNTSNSRSIISNDRAILLSQSKASKGLKKALEAAQQFNLNSSESLLNKMMKDVALSYDFRLTIFASFYRVGFDLHDLTPNEKQRMEVIQLYPYLKNGEIWQDIKQELEDIAVRPTADDGHWMETSIEEALEQTEKAIHNQGLFSHDMKSKEQDELEQYFTTIRLKNQNTKQGGSMVSKKAKK